MPKLQCSFCGKSHEEVSKLIAGPRVYICDACVSICHEILARESVKPLQGRVEHNLVKR
jgi:ATP-dependent Clp protease ATP-binding subunit ClpX